MIRKAITLLSLLCVVLCAFVGFVSYKAVQESEKSDPPAVDAITCDAFLNDVPSATSKVLLTEFAPGKQSAHWDNDSDGEWESLCVPIFPRKNIKITHGYNAVLVYFNDVKDRESLDEIIKSGELEANFWPLRQDLDVATHSLLAQQYENLDFSKSPVLHYGFKTSNPLLGQKSLMASAAVGTLSIVVGFLSMVVGFFMRKPTRSISINEDKDEDEEKKPTTNRAGLPIGGAGMAGSIFDTDDKAEPLGILDKVTSLRN